MSRSAGAFSGQFVSSRYTVTRPTAAFQTRARHIAPGNAHGDAEPAAVRSTNRLHRQVTWVVIPILGVLDAVVVHDLLEIALPVEQAHGDEIHTLVAGRLAVVARQHAEAAGIDGKAFVEAILRAEVGHQRSVRERRRGDVFVERLQGLTVAAEIGRVLRGAGERGLAHATEQQARVAFGLFPQLRVEILEQRAGGPMPAKKQIRGKLGQPREGFRDHRCDFKYRVSHNFSAIQGRASLAARGLVQCRALH